MSGMPTLSSMTTVSGEHQTLSSAPGGRDPVRCVGVVIVMLGGLFYIVSVGLAPSHILLESDGIHHLATQTVVLGKELSRDLRALSTSAGRG